MHNNISGINFWPFVFLALGLLSCSLLNSPGTIDVHTWARWLQDYLDYGPFAGYAHNKTDYPPLMIFIFYLFAKGFAVFSINSFMSIKITILFFALLATILVFYWTKNYALTALFHLSFIINSVCLGYADVILGCFLIFALMQLQKRMLISFAFVFSLAIFIKWQVLIISPFLFFYIFSFNKKHNADQLQKLKETLIPFLIVCGAVVYAFGFRPLYGAFTWAFHHLWLSGYAFNIHWIITFLYQTISPETFGGLNNGEISYIGTKDIPVPFLLAKLIFVSGFCYVLFIFSRIKVTFENLLVFSLAGYLLYFTFNTGVHENHLFLALMLGVILTAINASWLSLTIYIALAFNVNMLLIYGIDGRFHFARVIQNTLDPTLAFALLNTLLFSYTCYRLVAIGKRSPLH